MWIRPSGPPKPTLSASIRVRRHVHLVLTVNEHCAESVWVALWSGEPESSDGLAVVQRGDDLVGVAHIPLCTCGDRNCGHAELQLATELAADDLPALVDLLQALPDISEPPTRGATWHGEFQDGEPVT